MIKLRNRISRSLIWNRPPLIPLKLFAVRQMKYCYKGKTGNGGCMNLINDSLYQQLQTPATFFLKTKLLPEDSGIKAINFPGYRVSKHEGIWKVDPGLDISADNITGLVHAWRNADAISIRDYEDSDNAGTVRVELEDGNIFEFFIVTPPPQLVLARPDIGLQYHISGDDAEQLFLKSGYDEASPVDLN